jgi:hypothetical protein
MEKNEERDQAFYLARASDNGDKCRPFWGAFSITCSSLSPLSPFVTDPSTKGQHRTRSRKPGRRKNRDFPAGVSNTRGEVENRRMYFQRTAIGWTPGGDVDVIAINELGRSEWFDKHPGKVSPAWRTDMIDITGAEAQLAVLAHFHMLVVRDKIDPAKVHKAFMDINEYRDAISMETLPAAVPRWVMPTVHRAPPFRRHTPRKLP